MPKTYDTPKRTHIVKTRLDDEEHADFLHQVEIYGMNQSEFIREAKTLWEKEEQRNERVFDKGGNA